MTNGKKRNEAHILGAQAVRLFTGMLPPEWVVREYTPDYGIDLELELFEFKENSYMAAGEHIYVQVKGTKHPDYGTYEILGHSNKIQKIDVLKFRLDTALLSTVEKMGSAVSVLLVVCDLLSDKAYFICLNDYIEKVILPERPDYQEQDKVLIYIPLKNKIENVKDTDPIAWYGKRGKLFAFFNKLNYMNNELQYVPDEQLKEKVLYYRKILHRLDAWSASDFFQELKRIRELLDECHELSPVEIRKVWKGIAESGTVYEAIGKEWFLPTAIGQITTE